MVIQPVKQAPEKGQVWTPALLAERVVRASLEHMASAPRVAIDAGTGPGTFLLPLQSHRYAPAQTFAYETDRPLAASTASQFAHDEHVCVTNRDYLMDSTHYGRADLVVMNPPYVRHERIPLAAKERYRAVVSPAFQGTLDRRSNLFAYFVGKAQLDLRAGGVLAAVLYESAFSSAYGKQLRREIDAAFEIRDEWTEKQPFEGALIDARVLIAVKRENAMPLAAPIHAQPAAGWARLEDLLESRRGTGLSYRRAFIAQRDDPCFRTSLPILMKQQDPDDLVVGAPKTRAYIFSRESENPRAARLVRQRLALERRDLSRIHHRQVSGPILFNYFVRSNPRHLFNGSEVCASDNFYVSRPRDKFPSLAAWLLLNSKQYNESILRTARAQGNGLTKLQLSDYRSATIPDWREVSPGNLSEMTSAARSLVKTRASADQIRDIASAHFETGFSELS